MSCYNTHKENIIKNKIQLLKSVWVQKFRILGKRFFGKTRIHAEFNMRKGQTLK